MRTTPLSTWTVGDLKADLQSMLGVYTEEDLVSGLILSTINRGVSELYGFNGWADADEYNDYIEIPTVKKVSCSAIAGSGYDTDTKQLKLPANDAINWTNDSGFNSAWINATGTIRDTDAGITYSVKVIKVIDSETIVLVDPLGRTIPSIAAADLTINITTEINKQSDNVNLTHIPVFKQIDSIIKVTYTVQVRKPGDSKSETKVRLAVGPPSINSKDFEGIKFNRHYEDQVLWIREGEWLQFQKGKNLISYGTRKLFFVLQPIEVTNEDDYIDIKNDNIPQLLDYLVVKLINAVKDPSKIKMTLPQSLIDWFNRVQARKNETMQEKTK